MGQCTCQCPDGPGQHLCGCQVYDTPRMEVLRLGFSVADENYRTWLERLKNCRPIQRTRYAAELDCAVQVLLKAAAELTAEDKANPDGQHGATPWK
jgi:hypothetical protein